jgi:alanine racemase
VAARAGVSVATVSRVLNGISVVRRETRDKVLAAVRELNYQPNFTGRNLRTQNTKLILVLLPTLANPFFSKVLKGMEACAAKNGYSVLICATYENRDTERTYLKLVKNKLADGAVFMKTSLSQKEFIDFAKIYPAVQCSEYFFDTPVPYISIDNEAAAYEAVCHLINKGAKKILLFSADNDVSSTVKRTQGYLRALKAHNINFSDDNVIKGNYGYRSSISLLDRKLKAGYRCDGIFAISDKMAAGCVRALKNNGIDVPERVRVVGFDNAEISYTTTPEITTVSQSQYDMGYAAAEALIGIISGKTGIVSRFINHKLIIRKSSAL